MDDSTRLLIERLTILLDRSRHMRIIGYFLLTAGGVLSFYAPTDAVRHSTGTFVIYLLAVAWTVPSFIALVSSIRDRLDGESFAIPLIGSALIGFAVVLFKYGGVAEGRTWASACFLTAFGAFLADRWFECRALREGVVVMTEDLNGDEGAERG